MKTFLFLASIMIGGLSANAQGNQLDDQLDQLNRFLSQNKLRFDKEAELNYRGSSLDDLTGLVSYQYRTPLTMRCRVFSASRIKSKQSTIGEGNVYQVEMLGGTPHPFSIIYSINTWINFEKTSDNDLDSPRFLTMQCMGHITAAELLREIEKSSYLSIL